MKNYANIFDLDRWNEIWNTISRNKMRSFMTAMGVFWPVTLLVVLLGVSGGLKGYINDNLAIPSNATFLFSNATSLPYKGFPIGRRWSFKMDDLERVARSVDGVEQITPMWSDSRNESLKVEDREYTANVSGTTAKQQNINKVKVTKGRFINEMDQARSRKVCVIGASIYNVLFPDGGDPSGEKISIGGDIYHVVGVMERSSNMVHLGGNVEESIYIPYSTMQLRYNISNNAYGVGLLVEDGYDTEAVQERVAARFRELYNISDEDSQAVNIFNTRDIFDMFSSLFLGLDILIWIIGIGTLLAGVIGVSNIMLIVLKERTQEIGVRRALGATPNDIISQILTESFILTLIAGVMALGASVALLHIVDKVLVDSGLKVQVGLDMAVLTAIIIVISGVLSGVIPAQRAIAIKAVDAIREE